MDEDRRAMEKDSGGDDGSGHAHRQSYRAGDGAWTWRLPWRRV